MPGRARDHTLLLTVSALLTLPGLGATSLWDVDEGVNAQAAREMRDADTWVIPTFNYHLRTAKPVMLYWLQRASYAVFGVSEWSARLPSALAGCLSVLLTYELGRRLFGRATGLLAGIILASCVQFAILSHAATPDALLLTFTLLAMLAFWVGHEDGSRAFWVPTAVACGLAVLTKGPVGVVLPGLVILAYFAWNRELSRLLDRRLAVAALVFVLVAGPWYALVASETRGEWVKAFWGHDNVGRFLRPLEGHRGPIWYYPVAVAVLFAPWSAVLGVVVWFGYRGVAARTDEPGPAAEVRACRFLICWIGAYLMFFTAAATKLPNYVYPLYPPLAVLTARLLVAWQDGGVRLRRWVMPVGLAVWAGVGVMTGVGLLVAGRLFPGLGSAAWLGLVPVGGAAVGAVFLRAGYRPGVVGTMAATAAAFVGLAVVQVPPILDRYKAPRELVRHSGADTPDRDLRLATFRWFQPSLVFYSGRQIEELADEAAVAEFLAVPTPAYVFVAEPAWGAAAAAMPPGVRVAARQFDGLRNCHVLVVTNEPAADTSR